MSHRRIVGRILAVTMALGLGACATTPVPQESFAPAYPAAAPVPPPGAGSLYQARRNVSLFQDVSARRVGDILTVVLVERTSASKKASTSTSRSDKVDLPNPTLLGAPLSFNAPGRSGMDLGLATSVDGSNTFSGAGDAAQSNSLEGRITVTVADVLPNGNLFVRGQKRVRINQGDEYLQFSGIVRPTDVRADNTVISTLVADARIVYTGEGAVASANARGWLGRFFNSKWWPF
ncbi:MAG TPA: flagellar basal body L-ring protein FlgH [Gammaproteobacteria bacterium]|nr:flagellar basal body L-ring protein FlgH [Gammaproteobacteria bacterium]